jgi:triacylglycerol esterase/lipase EstA (alpha/beta hydrolase family)
VTALMPRRAIGCLVALALALCYAGDAGAQAKPLAPPDRPGPELTNPQEKMAAALHCTESVASATRSPVLLSPGTALTSEEAFGWNYEPALTRLGIPWCALDSPDHTLADIQDIGEYFTFAIRHMHRLSGRKVSIVGHSQGGMNFRWALRYWPDVRRMVDDAVSLAGDNHGTETINTLGACSEECPPGAWQQVPGSAFLHALNSPAETFAGISYTQIYTNYDTLATPAGADGTTPLRTGAGQITNVALQDLCPANTADHTAIGTTDPVAFALAIDALDHPGPAAPDRIDRSVCSQSEFPGVDRSRQPDSLPSTLYLLAAATPVNLVGVKEVRQAPPLRCYVFADCVLPASIPRVRAYFGGTARRPILSVRVAANPDWPALEKVRIALPRSLRGGGTKRGLRYAHADGQSRSALAVVGRSSVSVGTRDGGARRFALRTVSGWLRPTARAVRSLRSGRALTIRARITAADGSVRVVREHVRLLRAAGGSV